MTSTVRPNGPWDINDVADLDGYVDFSSLLLRPLEGLGVTTSVNDDGSHGPLTAVAGRWQMTLELFAAPKSTGTWASVADSVSASVTADGGAVVDSAGAFGRQLDLRLPEQAGGALLRLVGVDGPGWLLRATVRSSGPTSPAQTWPQGQVGDEDEAEAVESTVTDADEDLAAFTATADEALSAGLLGQVLRAVVVRRGSDPHPVGAALPVVIDPRRMSRVGTDGAAVGVVTGAPAVEDVPSRFASLPELVL